MLADLAHDGRTVIVVTHSVVNLNLCDRLLVLAPGGKIAFFGPPADGLPYFGQPDWAEVFQAFEAEPDRDWADDYRRSRYYQRYVAADLDGPEPSAGQDRPRAVPPATRNRLAQLSTLCRRYLAVIASDRTYLGVLAVLPLILGALALVVPAQMGLTGPGNAAAPTVLLVLVVGACFTGAANAVRELVKERAIYTRERAAGVSAGAYLVSKLVILGMLSAVQAVVLTLIGLADRKLPPTGSFLTHVPLAELLLAISVLAVVSMTLGLLISALASTSDKTLPLLVVVVMFQVILTGGNLPAGRHARDRAGRGALTVALGVWRRRVHGQPECDPADARPRDRHRPDLGPYSGHLADQRRRDDPARPRVLAAHLVAADPDQGRPAPLSRARCEPSAAGTK